MTDIEKLAAHAEICALKARYFRMMDAKDWAGLEATFAPDLRADFRAAAGGDDESQLIEGAARYVATLSGILANVITVHHGHMPEIHVESPTSAHGIWAMEDKLWVPEGSDLPFRRLHGYGHYHEKYVRLSDGWRIQDIRLSRLHLEVS